MPYGDTGAPLFLPLYADDEHNWGASMDATIQSLNDAIGDLQGIVGAGPDPAVIQFKDEKGIANGYAGLDASGLIPLTQLPPLAPTVVPGTPVGSIQFNNAGTFAGDSNLLWDSTGKLLKLGAGSGISFGMNKAITGDSDNLTFNATSADAGMQFNLDDVFVASLTQYGLALDDNYGFTFSDVGFYHYGPGIAALGAGTGDTSGGLICSTIQASGGIIGPIFSDVSDPTKQVQLILTSIASGTMRNLTIPNANSITVRNSNAPANQFSTGISGTGVIQYAQPSFSNLSGIIASGQLPNPLTATELDLGVASTTQGILKLFQVSSSIPAQFSCAGNVLTITPPADVLLQVGSSRNVTAACQGAGNFFLQNQSSATASVSQNSMNLILYGAYWTGSATAPDQWTIQNQIASGTNGASQLVFSHSGSPGAGVAALGPQLACQFANFQTIACQVNGTAFLVSNGNGMQFSFVNNNICSFGHSSGGPIFEINNGGNAAFVHNSRVIGLGDMTTHTVQAAFSYIGSGITCLGTSATVGDVSGALKLGNLTQVNPTLATASVSQNSPTQVLSGQYWNGSASAEDKWTSQINIASGTNGSSSLIFTHAGTTGASSFQTNASQVDWTAASALNLPSANGSGFSLTIGGYTAILFNGNSYTQIASSGRVATAPLLLLGNNGSGGSYQVFAGGGQAALGGTAACGVYLGMNGNGYIPTTGALDFAAAIVQMRVSQTGTASGNYCGLRVNIVEAALLGTAHKLLDLQAGVSGGVSQFAISNTGKIIVPSTNTTTSATAGSSGAAPSQVVGYLTVNINGTDRKIPYYAV